MAKGKMRAVIEKSETGSGGGKADDTGGVAGVVAGAGWGERLRSVDGGSDLCVSLSLTSLVAPLFSVAVVSLSVSSLFTFYPIYRYLFTYAPSSFLGHQL